MQKVTNFLKLTYIFTNFVFLAFLLPSSYPSKYSSAKANSLKQLYREFIFISQTGIELNEKLIGSDQIPYHEELKKNFVLLVNELSTCLRDNEFEYEENPYKSEFNDNEVKINSNPDDSSNKEINRISCQSIKIFDYISGSSTA